MKTLKSVRTYFWLLALNAYFATSTAFAEGLFSGDASKSDVMDLAEKVIDFILWGAILCGAIAFAVGWLMQSGFLGKEKKMDGQDYIRNGLMVAAGSAVIKLIINFATGLSDV